ncbi:MAG TPA: discoidin domain-containing protein, partial [Planctomycetota bacterium]|nr:discoidin domain-containing protein [Planctomycetota bacterium]
SHTQLIEKVPFTYEINVGGADHPEMNSLRVNLKGAAGDATYGYSDGNDVGGEKFQERWVTYGRNLAEGKPYTCSIPSGDGYGAGDPDGNKLTDGIVGPPVSGGVAFRPALIWNRGSNPEITVDLGKTEKCGAFRIQLGGYPWWDAVKGEVKDKVEVLVSDDGNEFKSVGFFNLNLRWKDIPANFAFNDDETFCGHNYEMIPEKPVEARYVRYVVTPERGGVTVSEVQVLDFIRYEPFDLRIALPDGRDRSDIAQYNPKHAPMQPYKPNRGN